MVRTDSLRHMQSYLTYTQSNAFLLSDSLLLNCRSNPLPIGLFNVDENILACLRLPRYYMTTHVLCKYERYFPRCDTVCKKLYCCLGEAI